MAQLPTESLWLLEYQQNQDLLNRWLEIKRSEIFLGKCLKARFGGGGGNPAKRALTDAKAFYLLQSTLKRVAITGYQDDHPRNVKSLPCLDGCLVWRSQSQDSNPRSGSPLAPAITRGTSETLLTTSKDITQMGGGAGGLLAKVVLQLRSSADVMVGDCSVYSRHNVKIQPIQVATRSS